MKEKIHIYNTPAAELSPEASQQRRRKVGRIALHSLEATFALATIAQAGNGIAQNFVQLSESPTAITHEDPAVAFEQAMEDVREQHIADSIDALSEIASVTQSDIRAIYDVSDSSYITYDTDE